MRFELKHASICPLQKAQTRRVGIVNIPPVSAWPEQVLPDEPVHGFFQRLAWANGQLSCRTLAAHLGLNGRNYDFKELLDFCGRLPAAGVENLATATPSRSLERVTLRGETFSPTHFGFLHVRICSACVSESRHHRNWFDLAFLENCPIHDQTMVEGLDKERLARWHPSIGIMPYSGLDLSQPVRRVQPQETLGRYILGRIGCLLRWRIPFLDTYTCGSIVQVSDLIGRMRAFGWAPKLRSYSRWDTSRRLRAENGFSILRLGPAAVLAELESFTAGSIVSTSPGQISFASGSFYGWLNSASAELVKFPVGETFRTLMLQNASRSGVFARKGYQARFDYLGAETLTSFSRKLGLQPKKVRELGMKDGLFRADGERSLHHSLTAETCGAMR